MKNKKFTTDDIKSGFLVELRNGERLIAARAGGNNFTKILVNPTSGKWAYLSRWDENSLCSKSMIFEFKERKAHRASDLDIMKVYGLIEGTDDYGKAFNTDFFMLRTRLWERREPVKMTLKQIEEKLGHAVQVVSEDYSNEE